MVRVVTPECVGKRGSVRGEERECAMGGGEDGEGEGRGMKEDGVKEDE